tara:strand:- start:22 stop:297 length:276 start_codon:yes stop_codon:yes gene_type:complete
MEGRIVYNFSFHRVDLRAGIGDSLRKRFPNVCKSVARDYAEKAVVATEKSGKSVLFSVLISYGVERAVEIKESEELDSLSEEPRKRRWFFR